jgi:hypothetical protein
MRKVQRVRTIEVRRPMLGMPPEVAEVYCLKKTDPQGKAER